MEVTVCAVCYCILVNILLITPVSAWYVYGESCVADKDCGPDAFCQSGTCACVDKFAPSLKQANKIECLKVANEFGATCVDTIQCSVKFGAKAECQKNSSSAVGKCACQKNSHFQDGICYESVRIGGHCKVNDNCISFSNVSTYCYKSKCICAPNYESNWDGTDCVAIQYTGVIGSPCTQDKHCKTSHTVCVSNICHCHEDFIISKDGKKCLVVAEELGGACSEDSQCTAFLKNSFCDSVVQGCQCVTNAREMNNSCWLTATLGESCNQDWECSTLSDMGVTCLNHICTCRSGLSMNPEKTDCIAKASLLEYSTLVFASVFIATMIL